MTTAAREMTNDEVANILADFDYPTPGKMTKAKVEESLDGEDFMPIINGWAVTFTT